MRVPLDEAFAVQIVQPGIDLLFRVRVVGEQGPLQFQGPVLESALAVGLLRQASEQQSVPRRESAELLVAEEAGLQIPGSAHTYSGKEEVSHCSRLRRRLWTTCRLGSPP